MPADNPRCEETWEGPVSDHDDAETIVECVRRDRHPGWHNGHHLVHGDVWWTATGGTLYDIDNNVVQRQHKEATNA